MKRLLTFSVLTIIITTYFASEIFAIPAFARKYNMTCKTCHSPFPKLKPYGDEFAANGFMLKDQDAPRYYLNTGDPELSLIRDLPLAFRLEGYVTYNKSDSKQSDFTTPLLFKLLTGGTITQDVSYFLYYILENGEVGKIEDAWLMFNNLFGSELDLTIGQFQVCDPLFKRELRLTRDDYFVYKIKPGDSNVDLTYDRGIMLAYGFESGTDLTVQVVNGDGIGAAFVNGNFDNDKYKNIMGRVSQDVGEHFRIGAMGYWGKEARDIQIFNGSTNVKNELWMLGGDATISLDPLELNVQYVHRNDSNPRFIADNTIESLIYPDYKIKSDGGFAELIYRPNGDDSNWYAVGLFNWIESDQSNLNLKSLAGQIGYLFRRNIRLVGELNYNFTHEYANIGVGFVTAF
jgi:hypothetical protein